MQDDVTGTKHRRTFVVHNNLKEWVVIHPLALIVLASCILLARQTAMICHYNPMSSLHTLELLAQCGVSYYKLYFEGSTSLKGLSFFYLDISPIIFCVDLTGNISICTESYPVVQKSYEVVERTVTFWQSTSGRCCITWTLANDAICKELLRGCISLWQL